MGQADELRAIEEALDGLREGMEADGYLMHVEGLQGGSLAIRIEATPEACEECLVQKELMGQMIQASLPETAGVNSVLLTYPTDSH